MGAGHSDRRATLLQLRRVIDDLLEADEQRKPARRRARPKNVVDIGALPGPKPTELDTKRAQRLVRSR